MSLPWLEVLASSNMSFFMRKGRWWVMVSRIFSACSLVRWGSSRAVSFLPFRTHRSCRNSSSASLGTKALLAQTPRDLQHLCPLRRTSSSSSGG